MTNIKTYTFPELKKIAKEQGYKMACLENQNGDRVQPYNKYDKTGKKLETQFSTIQNRLKSDIVPEGVYYVCFSQTITQSKNPDRYSIIKGDLKKNPSLLEEKPTITNPKETVIVHTKAEEVLSWDAALALHKEISELKSDNARLKAENEQLMAEIESLESEIDEENEGLQENKTSDVVGFLKETLPSLTGLLQEHFNVRNKELELMQEGKYIKQQTVSKPESKKRVIKPQIQIGSQEHLNLIEEFFTNGNEPMLNLHLDMLEKANPELYRAVCERLGIVEEGGEE